MFSLPARAISWPTMTTTAVPNRNDKSCLGLAARRKRRLLVQKSFILLTDLTHDLLADFWHRALVDTRFEGYRLKRIVRDLLATPGRLVFEAGELRHVE